VVVHGRRHAPGDVAAEALQAMRETYDNLDSEHVEETVAGQALVGYDLNFYCLDLTNTAVIRGVRTEHGTLLILYQAEDHDFAELEPVFRAMTVSLLQ
jgi:hypothetical protein